MAAEIVTMSLLLAPNRWLVVLLLASINLLQRQHCCRSNFVVHGFSSTSRILHHERTTIGSSSLEYGNYWRQQRQQQLPWSSSDPTLSTRCYAATPQPFTQVVSDVDDTLKSSGGVHMAGVALGGIDVQYPRGAYYPGVAEFMLHVSLGPTYSSLGTAIPNTPAKVAILTARAEEFKLALELKPDNPLSVAFREAGEAVSVSDWGLGPVLYGSVAEWIVQDRKGLRKFSNFERLLKQDPSGAVMQYVYVGDTGELDQEAGETMLREYPEVVKAVFLHVVSGKMNEPVTVPPPKLINGRPLVFFRTYVGAATAAVKLGLMSVQGLERVIDAACKKLKDVPKFSDKWMDLERDIERANRLLLL
jgi:hypothetical protein